MSLPESGATVRGMTRTRTCAVAIVALALLWFTAGHATAAAPKPARSGTITGWGVTWVAMFNGQAKDCQWSDWDAGGNPECLTWLQSRCDPALAGREPAVTASIEDVTTIADGTTPRVFTWRAARSPADVLSGGVVVQMWTKDCKEIRSAKWHSAVWQPNGGWTNRASTTLRIPSAARWMTVTTNDSANLQWALR